MFASVLIYMHAQVSFRRFVFRKVDIYIQLTGVPCHVLKNTDYDGGDHF